MDPLIAPTESSPRYTAWGMMAAIDLLQGFSHACYDEFEEMRPMRF